MNEVVRTLRELAHVNREQLRRQARHFGLDGFDADVAELDRVAVEFFRVAGRVDSDRGLTATGKQRALRRAARKADESIAALTSGNVKRLRENVAAMKARLITPAVVIDDQRMPNCGDLRDTMREAWVQRVIYDQVSALPLEQRNLLAKTSSDPRILQVLDSGAPVVSPGRDGVARVEPLVASEVMEELKVQRGRNQHPGLAQQLDELQAHLSVTDTLTAATRERIGLLVKSRSQGLDDVTMAKSGAEVLDLIAAKSLEEVEAL